MTGGKRKTEKTHIMKKKIISSGLWVKYTTIA
jgi:hypothetical protein